MVLLWDNMVLLWEYYNMVLLCFTLLHMHFLGALITRFLSMKMGWWYSLFIMACAKMGIKGHVGHDFWDDLSRKKNMMIKASNMWERLGFLCASARNSPNFRLIQGEFDGQRHGNGRSMTKIPAFLGDFPTGFSWFSPGNETSIASWWGFPTFFLSKSWIQWRCLGQPAWAPQENGPNFYRRQTTLRKWRQEFIHCATLRCSESWRIPKNATAVGSFSCSDDLEWERLLGGGTPPNLGRSAGRLQVRLRQQDCQQAAWDCNISIYKLYLQMGDFIGKWWFTVTIKLGSSLYFQTNPNASEIFWMACKFPFQELGWFYTARHEHSSMQRVVPVAAAQLAQMAAKREQQRQQHMEQPGAPETQTVGCSPFLAVAFSWGCLNWMSKQNRWRPHCRCLGQGKGQQMIRKWKKHGGDVWWGGFPISFSLSKILGKTHHQTISRWINY